MPTTVTLSGKILTDEDLESIAMIAYSRSGLTDFNIITDELGDVRGEFTFEYYEDANLFAEQWDQHLVV